MSDANDDTQNYALGTIAAVVALVIAGVLALSIWRTGAPKAGASAPVQTAVPAGAAAADAGGAAVVATEAAARVYFEVDSDALPADTAEALVKVAEDARVKGATVLISGFHDASGNAEHNADLAKRRAQAVKHALEANGVPPAQLVLDKPQQMLGGSDAREARRVELRLQP
ncbi:OmpA family protein [Piscinibacter sp.]|uniref:OmpA family protein n=1 Tax=Piscinibacter sp. TaxID=1903157 RepID=UPI0039E39BFE